MEPVPTISSQLVTIDGCVCATLQAINPYMGWLEGYAAVFPDVLPYLWPVYLMPYTAAILITVLVSADRYIQPIRQVIIRLLGVIVV